MKILVADDSKLNLAMLAQSLTDLGHEVIAVSSGESAIQQFELNRPDLIILDVVMKGMNGFETAQKIRATNNEDWIPIIFLSTSVDDKSIAQGIDAGGDDYLSKPFSEVTLSAKIKAMQRIADMRKKLCDLTDQLSILSTTDPLTGLYNRLQFDRVIRKKVADADRNNQTIALLFIDLDSFKKVNDTLGHGMGDLLLKQTAKRLLSCLRESDFISRLGGDEFAVILEVTNDPKHVSHIAKKIIDSLSNVYTLENKTAKIGVSIGIEFYPKNSKNVDELILHADKAMYSVKEKSKNNFAFYCAEMESCSDSPISR